MMCLHTKRNVGTMARENIYRLRLNDHERSDLDAMTVLGGFPSVAAFIRDAVERAKLKSQQPLEQSAQSLHDRPAP